MAKGRVLCWLGFPGIFWLCILLLAASPSFAVPETSLPAASTQIRDWYQVNISTGRWKRPGTNVELGYSFKEGDANLPPVLQLVGLADSYAHYDEVLYDLRHLNNAIITLELRGQAHSRNPADDFSTIHITSVDAYVEDLLAFVRSWVAERYRLPVLLMAHSTGGLAGMLAAQEEPALFRRIFLVSPLVKPYFRGIPMLVGRSLVDFACWLDYCDRRIAVFDEYRKDRPFDGNVLTHSELRFRRIFDRSDKTPILQHGGPSYGWLQSVLIAADRLEKTARQLTVPITMAVAEEDKIVDSASQIELCGKLPSCATLRFPGAFHVLLHEEDRYRDPVMSAYLEFLSHRP